MFHKSLFIYGFLLKTISSQSNYIIVNFDLALKQTIFFF